MKKDKRFDVIRQDGSMSGICIIVDRRTGVRYLYRQEGYSGGMCVLVDRDGKPLVEGQENE